jgi:hypothetical protein
VRRLSIEAATPKSGLELFTALSAFQPRLEFGDKSACVISVELGSETRTVQVLAALDEFLHAHAVATAPKMAVYDEELRVERSP